MCRLVLQHRRDRVGRRRRRRRGRAAHARRRVGQDEGQGQAAVHVPREGPVLPPLPAALIEPGHRILLAARAYLPADGCAASPSKFITLVVGVLVDRSPTDARRAAPRRPGYFALFAGRPILLTLPPGPPSATIRVVRGFIFGGEAKITLLSPLGSIGGTGKVTTRALLTSAIVQRILAFSARARA